MSPISFLDTPAAAAVAAEAAGGTADAAAGLFFISIAVESGRRGLS